MFFETSIKASYLYLFFFVSETNTIRIINTGSSTPKIGIARQDLKKIEFQLIPQIIY